MKSGARKRKRRIRSTTIIHEVLGLSPKPGYILVGTRNA